MDTTSDKEVELLFDLIKDVRNYKIDNKLAPNLSLQLSVNFKIKVFDDFLTYLKRFTFSDIKVVGKEIVNCQGDLFMHPNADMLINNESGKAEMIERIKKEIATLESEIARCEKMLSNPNFIDKAPKEKVELEQNKLTSHKKNLEDLTNKLKNLE